MKKQKVIFYRDELNDEFAGDSIQAKPIDAEYTYIRKGMWAKIEHIFWYRVIAMPLAFCYMKLYFHHTVVNRQILKNVKDSGYFLYGNHTHFLADALVPTLVTAPKTTYVIVHPNNVSMPVLGRITPSLGALPLPDDAQAGKNFLHAVKQRIQEQACVMIYPEAHIWPYYTDIRPFTDSSFRYPVREQVPVFCLTNTYQKRKLSRRPKLVTYLDGPFYADTGHTAKEQKQELRDQVYSVMKERAKNNTVCMVRYQRAEDADEVSSMKHDSFNGKKKL